MDDMLKKYIECKEYIALHEDEVCRLLQTKYNSSVVVNGNKYYVTRTTSYEYSSATNNLLKQSEAAKLEERKTGTARMIRDGYRVYVRNATPSVVLAS